MMYSKTPEMVITGAQCFIHFFLSDHRLPRESNEDLGQDWAEITGQHTHTNI